MVSSKNPGGGSGTVGGTAPAKPSPAKPPVKAAPPTAGTGLGLIGPPAVAPPRNHPGPVGNDPHPVRSAPTPATPAPAGTAPDMSPIATLIDTLNSYGLGSLASWAWQEHTSGKPDAQIVLDLRQTDAYKQRFVGMAQLQQAGQAITESDYIAKERADTELLRSYGLPDSMANDRSLLGNLIGNQVSTSELQSRLQTYQTAVLQAPQATRDYLQQNFGIGTGDLMSYWLNPSDSLPDLQQKAAAAQIGGIAQMSGYGFLDAQEALRLAGLGVSQSAAQQGFSHITASQELTQNLGDGSGSVSNGELLAGTLEGDTTAALHAQQVAAGRVAKFQNGGTFAAGQQGVSGLGVGSQGF